MLHIGSTGEKSPFVYTSVFFCLIYVDDLAKNFV